MNLGFLPRQVDTRRLAARQAAIKGGVPADGMPRLKDAGVKMTEPAFVCFTFTKDEQGRCTLFAQLKAELILECQRCLEPMQYPIQVTSNIACVASDAEAAALPAYYEPLLVGDLMDLWEVAEEELLLAVPVSPTHKMECRSTEQLSALEEKLQRSDVAEGVRDNPFAVLDELKR